jgi:hypothetical protein
MTLQQPGQSEPTFAARAQSAVIRYLRRFDEGEVIRWAFRGMLIGTIGVLAMDLWELSQQGGAAIDTPDVETSFLPPEVEVRDPAEKGIDPRDYLKIDEDKLRAPMLFTLGPNGVLTAEGMIDPGAADRLAEELETRGEYVATVSLNSPGGSVEDAMTMGKLLRENDVSTEVADGALCASSCPLIFAGGQKRIADKQAAIGVHQFFAVGEVKAGAEQAMADAQSTTARITRYLTELGVDPALRHTPPREMYPCW